MRHPACFYNLHSLKITQPIEYCKPSLANLHNNCHSLCCVVSDYKMTRNLEELGNTAAVSDHRTAQTAAVTVEPAATAIGVITEAAFFDIFQSANYQAWSNITADPLLTLSQSCHGLNLVQYAKCLLDHCETLKDTLAIFDAVRSVFTKRPLVSESDKECIMKDIQCIRESSAIVDEFVDFVRLYIPSCDTALCKQLFQVWLRKLVIVIMSCVASRCREAVAQGSVAPLSDIDQNVDFAVGHA